MKHSPITKDFIEFSTPDEVILAELLLMNPEFLFEIKKIRNKIKIRPNPRKNWSWTNIDVQTQKSLKYYSKKICKKYGIPWWLWTVEEFIITNQFRRGRDNDVMGNSKNPLSVQLRKSVSNKFIKIYGFEIVINKRVSRTKLHKLVDKNWSEIETVMNLGTAEEFNTKIKKVSYFKEIINLRDKNKLSFSKIADKMISKYEDANDPSITDFINEDSIKTSYHRIKTLINSLGNS